MNESEYLLYGLQECIERFSFEESKHPRGQPKNKGQFAKGRGGSSAQSPQELKGSDTKSSKPIDATSFISNKNKVNNPSTKSDSELKNESRQTVELLSEDERSNSSLHISLAQSQSSPAEMRNAEDFGISKGTVSREQAISRARSIAKEHGIDIVTSRVEELLHINTESTLASFTPLTGKIFINENHSDWDDIQNSQEQDYSFKFSSSYHPDATIHHEIGHALHYKKNPLKYVSLSLLGRLNRSDSEAVKQEVSKYASTHPNEFVAEVYSAIKTINKKYSDRIMNLYRKYGGPDL